MSKASKKETGNSPNQSKKPPQMAHDKAGKERDVKNHADVDLTHTFNYVGGSFAYKNSRQRKHVLDPKNQEKSVLITGYGRARPVAVAKRADDKRAGNFPQHNSPDEFKDAMELLEARSLETYKGLNSIDALEKKGFKHRRVSLTKERLHKIAQQFCHLSVYAFNQMMCINAPDKRDFDVWFKYIKKKNQLIVAYPHSKTGLTQFIQVIHMAANGEVLNIKHCMCDKGLPIVVNETGIDQYNNIRQIAHIGAKNGVKNAVERFDDATVAWTVTTENETASAALRPNGEITILGEDVTPAAMLAAKNLGAESLAPDGTWSDTFCLQACLANDNPLQRVYKESIRKQINQIVDGAAIPGLEPIFKLESSSDQKRL